MLNRVLTAAACGYSGRKTKNLVLFSVMCIHACVCVCALPPSFCNPPQIQAKMEEWASEATGRERKGGGGATSEEGNDAPIEGMYMPTV